MTEPQWDRLKKELKQIQPNERDKPEDMLSFKQQVLQEYDRRTRVEQRSRWLRRSTIALTITLAVFCGLLITSPFQEDGAIKMPDWQTFSQPSANQMVQGLAPYEVVSSYFNLLLQRRVDDASIFFAESLRQERDLVTPNQTNPHMTGYTIYNASKGNGKIQYSVRVSWGWSGAAASSEAYEVTVRENAGRWEISGIKRSGEVTYDGTDGLEIVRTQRGKAEVFLKQSDWSNNSRWTMFAADPSFTSQLVFVEPKPAPEIYMASVGMKPQLLVKLPAGEVEEIFWTDTNLLAVNFKPAGSSEREILIYEATTGRMRDANWMSATFRVLGAKDLQVMHTLPNEKIRVRAGEGTYLVDLKARRVAPDSSLGQVAMVKFDVQNVELPVEGLNFSYPDRTPEFLDTVDVIPSDQKVDLQKETGLYVFNGKLNGFSLKGSELQVQLMHEKNRVQVVTVPYEMLRRIEGESFVVKVFDDRGRLLADPYEVTVPKR